MKRFLDLFICIPAVFFFIIPSIIIFIIIKLTSKGPAIYWSLRVGKDNILFNMPKFRSMKITTPEIPTYELSNPEIYVTSFGKFLRKYSLDEIPQLISIISGHMSIVGPRPALHNEKFLINERFKLGIQKLKPGLTGWAQINGRDNIDISKKLSLDFEYLEKKSIYFDIHIILKTFIKVLRGENVGI